MTAANAERGIFHRCWYLTGPTACGKTAVSLELARRLPVEIVAMDSMTLYRGMDVGTGKPSLEEQAVAPHHLLDVLNPDEPASVSWYLQQAEAACREIFARGGRPLFVGGTPLYLKALLRGMFDGPPANPELRRRWQSFAEEHGGEALRSQLARVDPAAAQRLQAGDLRRLIRAMEVYETTGSPISELQRQFDRPADPPPAVVCLQRDRAELYDRIHRRIDAMFDAGWVEEVQRLLAGPRRLGREAAQAAGYHEIAELLAGRITREQMLEQIRRRTRRLAKHQLTWFRGLAEIRFLPVEAEESTAQIADRCARFFASCSAGQ